MIGKYHNADNYHIIYFLKGYRKELLIMKVYISVILDKTLDKKNNIS